MAQASQAEEPSMEEILASIRRIISDEDTQAKDGDAGADASEDNPVEIEAADDMGDSAEMNQDDLDKLFDMDDDDDVAEPESEAAADDDMAAAMAEVAAEEEVEEDDDILELTEELELSEDDMAVAEEPMELVGGMPDDLEAEGSDVAFVEESEEPAVSMSALMAAAAPKPAPKSTIETAPVPDEDLPEVADDAPLTSDMTGEAVNAAFDNLSNLFVGGQAQTVEELIREMLRPMLKAWLDQNLPGMVEQMIKKEIERVTRRR
ncbi:DUF2497 domain-containing protein [Roseibium sp.]|uniref:PopZ family protein n=1 Tax=Roseibium sp. TaxID=1936156 RepID=UPI003266708B